MADSDLPPDLLDLKFLPAWVKESGNSLDYSNFEGEESEAMSRREKRPRRASDRKRNVGKSARRDRDDRPTREREDLPRNRERRRDDLPVAPPKVAVGFLPHAPSLENVIAQIKSGTVAYSVYALARMFLAKPERYRVKLTSLGETPLFQLGEAGPVSIDRRLLENNAFALARDDFYKIEVIQSEPLKGNFSNVARCRLSGTLLGPTNHHSYQAQLRTLYEQRFSRRMSFADYQRQIDIVSDPAAVEQWKEQARNVTTFTTLREGTPLSFTNAAEAERHFHQHYLPTFLRSAQEFIIDGVTSRQLPDRPLGRVIEDAWSHEIRSPSRMMQELAGALRPAGLNLFRHRRGIFVSPIRSRVFRHGLSDVSQSIGAILEVIQGAPGINRKGLAEKLGGSATESEDPHRSKMTLAADLKWLVSEGYIIEFNDGSLDLPRVRPSIASVSDAEQGDVVEIPGAINEGGRVAKEISAAPSAPDMEEGGMSLEQPVGPALRPSLEAGDEDPLKSPAQIPPTSLREGAGAASPS